MTMNGSNCSSSSSITGRGRTMSSVEGKAVFTHQQKNLLSKAVQQKQYSVKNIFSQPLIHDVMTTRLPVRSPPSINDVFD